MMTFLDLVWSVKMAFLDLVWSVNLSQRDLPDSRRNVSSKAEVDNE